MEHCHLFPFWSISDELTSHLDKLHDFTSETFGIGC